MIEEVDADGNGESLVSAFSVLPAPAPPPLAAGGPDGSRCPDDDSLNPPLTPTPPPHTHTHRHHRLPGVPQPHEPQDVSEEVL
jgi:hypothetical protein